MKKKKTTSLPLTTNLYKKCIKCTKALWLHLHLPLYKNQAHPDDISLQKSDKNYIYFWAKKLFSNGIEIKAKTSEKKRKETLDLINNKTSTIFNATFSYKNTWICIDIIKKNKTGWDILIIKNSSKDNHYFSQELGLYFFILKKLNLNPQQTSIIQPNKHFIKSEHSNFKETFIIKNVTKKVKEHQDTVENHFNTILKTLKMKIIPSKNIGTQCLKPKQCEYYSYCWKSIPKNSIFTIKGLNINKKFKLFQEGIIDPQDLSHKISLTERQKLQISSKSINKTIVKKKELSLFLKEIKYPIYFLDFEAFSPPLPVYKNTKSYDLIPFLYSVHILKSKYGTPLHKQHMILPDKDPRRDIANSITQTIGLNGSIIIFDAGLEKKIFKLLSTLFPEKRIIFEHYLKNIIDIKTPFKQNIIYHQAMEGSLSLKNIVSALDSNISYQSLDIKSGENAAKKYLNLLLNKNFAKKKEIEQQLITYSKQDTLSLVNILKKMYSYTDADFLIKNKENYILTH